MTATVLLLVPLNTRCTSLPYFASGFSCAWRSMRPKQLMLLTPCCTNCRVCNLHNTSIIADVILADQVGLLLTSDEHVEKYRQ
jgi:hypothetical protein